MYRTMTKQSLTESIGIVSLPSAPSTLCFNKDEFMKPDFNAEAFLVECRRRVSLENLRDDLRIYLKVVQSAMIELINKDYADFVNLSTNLVGLDKAINSLMHPLGQLQQDVVKVKTEMDKAIQNVQEKLNIQEEVRHKKACVTRLRSIIHSVEKMEKLLGIQTDENYPGHCPSVLNGQLIERVATQFNKLQFFVNKSRGQPLVEEIKPRIANITTTLQFSLEGSFRKGLETYNISILKQCLRTYATIDKMRDAENLFRQHTVKPYLEEVINEPFMNSSPSGLKGMYVAILDFIPKHCKILKEVTSGNIPGGGEVVRGYDFIVNSVWPEVISNIEARVPSIFAPGNPAVFHQKYSASVEFVEQFELLCGSQTSVKRLRSHPSYNMFLSKWSLPVYFQIRFQEIAGNCESALVVPLSRHKEKSEFLLESTDILWLCLHQCWQPGVFLPALCHRFWKLNLQILSRYKTWMDFLADNHLKESKMEQIQSSASTVSLRSLENINPDLEHNTLHMLTTSDVVYLLADTFKLSEMISTLYEDSIKSKVAVLGFQDPKLLQDALSEQQQSFLQSTVKFEKYVIQEINIQCRLQLRNVNDIPRLYRRTNREKPSRPSLYVENLVKPIVTFIEMHDSLVSQVKLKEWMTATMECTLEQYLAITSDVLISVKKMEESLKRLKQKKKSENKGLSDDDKIRLQLYLDVTELGIQIEKMGLSKESLKNYDSLFSLVSIANTSSVGC